MASLSARSHLCARLTDARCRARLARLLLGAGILLGGTAAPCGAQAASPPGFVEGIGGYTGFGDEGVVNHGMFGGGVRWRLWRFHVGPEFVHMIGPGRDRDTFLTGTLAFDLRGGAPAVTPYLLVNAGVMFHSPESAVGGPAFTLGGGARFTVTDRTFIAPEVRLGSPAHFRFGLAVGYRFGE